MKNILATLAFFATHPQWHSVKGKLTVKAAESLRVRGYLERNEFNQYRFTGKVFA